MSEAIEMNFDELNENYILTLLIKEIIIKGYWSL